MQQLFCAFHDARSLPTHSHSNSYPQAIQRTRVLLLQQDANSVLVNFLGELFTDGVEPNAIEIETALSVL